MHGCWCRSFAVGSLLDAFPGSHFSSSFPSMPAGSERESPMAFGKDEKVKNRKSDLEHRVQPSGYDSKNSSTSDSGETAIQSPTPETEQGQINPSAPNDVNQGSWHKQGQRPTGIDWRIFSIAFHGSCRSRAFHSENSATVNRGGFASSSSFQFIGTATGAPARARGEYGAIEVEPRSFRR